MHRECATSTSHTYVPRLRRAQCQDFRPFRRNRRSLLRLTARPSWRELDTLSLAYAMADALRAKVPSDHPFTDSEARATVASVLRYRRAHGWRSARERAFTELQRLRGRLSGRARRARSVEAAAPWAVEGCSRATWYRRVAREHDRALDVPADPFPSPPWLEAGVSRATWYRHRAAERVPAPRSPCHPWLDLGISRATWYRRHGPNA